MEINQDYMHFKRWYKDTERAIHCGQWDDEQIAYAGYCEGMKRVKTCNKPAVSKCEEFEREASCKHSDWTDLYYSSGDYYGRYCNDCGEFFE